MAIIVQVIEGIARLSIENPPVNALSIANGTVAALQEAVQSADRNPDVALITIEGSGRCFSGGADVQDFALGADLAIMRSMVETVGAAVKPVVTLIHGECLGGGLELALAADYRVATPDARLGLPEITLGLIPGSGGTQRLPRLIGPLRAAEMMLSGKADTAADALASGLIDAVTHKAGLCGEARALAARGKRRMSECIVARDAGGVAARGDAMRRQIERSKAAKSIIELVELAQAAPFQAGLARERASFAALMVSPESQALRHAFVAERAVRRVPGLEDVPPRTIRTVGIVGAGTMGCGIALAVLAAGFSVILFEQQGAVREAALRRIGDVILGDVAKGRLSASAAEDRRNRLRLADSLESLVPVDLAIEAVYEDLAVKRDVLRAIAGVVSDRCILASNTSTLDLNRLAEVVTRPGRVVGMHFFSPAQIMRLVEVIRTSETAPDVIATAMVFAKQLGKVGVVSEVCDGFIGNRMFEEYLRQSYLLLEEGALPDQIDNALEAWGMAMGPIRTMDLAGQDIGYSIRRRRANEQPDRPYSRIPDLVVEMGRHGQKTGAGFYLYPDSRKAVPDPAIDALIVAESQRLGLVRRAISATEIVERCVFALVNEGAKILDEGIAARPLDIDMVWLHGYGFPRTRGGPMFYADALGLDYALARIQAFAGGREGWAWQPAPLLERIARGAVRFTSLNVAPAK